MTTRLVLASNNAKKAAELHAMLAPLASRSSPRASWA
jgi:inosine/xanthosine triphosphate pyrophosphatase family protein